MSAALSAKKAGAKSIALFERKEQWGAPVQCAGYAPRLLGRILPFDSAAVRCKVDSLQLFHEGALLKDLRSPGYMLRREVLEKQAAEAAMREGVLCFQPCKVIAIQDDRLAVEDGTVVREHHARIIIGADGPRSIVRRAMHLPDQVLATGLEYELPMTAPPSAAEIHFSPTYGAGYAWVFPHGNGIAGIGLALDPDRQASLRPMLQSFIEGLAEAKRLKIDHPHRIIAGPVPISGPVEATAAGRMLLVGDAAGQTNALTGAGIYTAAACGEIAGRIAARAILEEDLDILSDYESEWRDLLDLLLIRAVRGRSKMIEATSSESHLQSTMEAWNIRRKNSQA